MLAESRRDSPDALNGASNSACRAWHRNSAVPPDRPAAHQHGELVATSFCRGPRKRETSHSLGSVSAGLGQGGHHHREGLHGVRVTVVNNEGPRPASAGAGQVVQDFIPPME